METDVKKLLLKNIETISGHINNLPPEPKGIALLSEAILLNVQAIRTLPKDYKD